MSPEVLEVRKPAHELNDNLYPNARMINENLWGRLTGRMIDKEGFDPATSERVMNEALGFLKACAENPSEALSPSEAVDAGWHTFILYTKDYAEFCEREAGYFIHHEPSDNPQPDQEGMTIKETYDFLEIKGYDPDCELWEGDFAIASLGRCSSHCRNTCNHGSQ